MRRISEVLRLAGQGMSRRQISQSLRIGHSTVHDYLGRAEQAGLGWPLPSGLDDAGLEALLFPRPAVPGSRPEPDWPTVHRELKSRKHMTLRLLWLEYRQAQPDGLGYSRFCERYKQWLGRQDVVMRLSYPAGERLFIDFCGDTIPVVDPETGEIRQAQVFVAALGYSGCMYVEAVWGQDLPCWLAAHTHAFQFMGGVAKILVPDNLKSGVTDPCWYDPEINPSYLELATHFGAVVLPARPHHPRDKAICEAAVQVTERWIIAPLRKLRFFGLAAANAAIRDRLKEVLDRPFRGLGLSRADLFQDERAALMPLPANRWEFATFKRAKVSFDYHIQFDGAYYSVPYRLVGEQVEVRATKTTVEILHKGKRVASHVRTHLKGKYVTDPEHMPAAHRAHREWTPGKLVEWGRGVGPNVGELVETILSTRPHPEHAYRGCMGLKRLAKEYGHERLDAACAQALAMRSPRYRTAADILKSGMDRVPPQPNSAPTPAIEHENVRGPEYYGREAV